MSSPLSVDINLNYPRKNAATFELELKADIPSEGITAIFGPSGSGKTTLLRCIAGLEKAQGRITFNQSTWQSHDIFLPTHKRPIGYVFQEALLFPHLNVAENLAFAERRSEHKADKISRKTLVQLFNLEHLLAQNIQQLSGGEQQRVAIVRALLIQPQCLLMDEPLASLDDHHKATIIDYLETLKKSLNIPILYVSHSMAEITRLADHILVMQEGKLIDHGRFDAVLNSTESPLHQYHDSGSVINAVVAEKDEQWQLAKINFDGGHLWLEDNMIPLMKAVRLRILAKDISLSIHKPSASSIVNVLPATIEEIKSDTTQTLNLVKITIGNTVLVATLTRRSINELNIQPKDQVWAQIKSAALVY